jgi:hypothetical protein
MPSQRGDTPRGLRDVGYQSACHSTIPAIGANRAIAPIVAARSVGPILAALGRATGLRFWNYRHEAGVTCEDQINRRLQWEASYGLQPIVIALLERSCCCVLQPPPYTRKAVLQDLTCAAARMWRLTAIP